MYVLQIKSAVSEICCLFLQENPLTLWSGQKVFQKKQQKQHL